MKTTIEPSSILKQLEGQLALNTEVLELVSRENQALREDDRYEPVSFSQARKTLLPRLEQSLSGLSTARRDWQSLSPAARARQPGVLNLLRANQDMILRIVMLDRENEQWLLRRGLTPAARLPAAQRQQPHVVVDLYCRHRGA